MDCMKTGSFIRMMRKKSGMTQLQLAEKLNVSDKAVSKWERGLGCPDISLLSPISELFGVCVEDLLSGEVNPETPIGDNMKNSSYYVCPVCGNISVCTGKATVSCCGKRLNSLTPAKPDVNHTLKVETVENDWFITSEHPMEKDRYISFVALATGDKLKIFKCYPEWELQLRIEKREHGMLLWYCTEHGLFGQYI